MNGRKTLVLFAIGLMICTLAACGQNKDETKIKEVAQKYFDALKIGDQEGVYDCYLPIERQKRDAELGLWGFASKLILNVNVIDVLTDLTTLLGGNSSCAEYRYTPTEVEMDEDGMNAVAYVDVYEEKVLLGRLCVGMTKHDGDWYVIKGTAAEVDCALRDSTINSEEADWRTGIGLPILIAAVLVTALAAPLLFFRLRSGRKRSAWKIPYADSLGEKMEQGDILCSCGMMNPAGIRKCMGCGKKIKRRR